MMSTEAIKAYDLIIVGGGLVGAGFALALQSVGLTIALIDARLPSHDDPRLFALNNGSCQFLMNLEVWDELAAHATPIHEVHVSHQHRFGNVRLRREDIQSQTLGHVIPAKHIEFALNNRLARSASNLTVYRPAKLIALNQEEVHVELVIQTENNAILPLKTSLLIGADGTESSVRKLAGIEIEHIDYQQQAIVTQTHLQRSHHQIAHERFTQHGAIAMLPLADRTCATIWSTSHEEAENLLALPEEAFVSQLQKEFGYRLGRFTGISKRHQFPLKMLKAKKTYHKNIFLLGNALHTLHPIAAQGFNLALYEVAILVEGISKHLVTNQTVSCADLIALSEATEKQQTRSINLSHRLSTLFTTDSRLVSIALQLGMVGLNIIEPAKKHFIKSLIGRTGVVPRLLIGSKDYDPTISARN